MSRWLGGYQKVQRNTSPHAPKGPLSIQRSYTTAGGFTLVYFMSSSNVISLRKKKAKKWKAAFFMTPPIYSPVDFRRHNFPNSCSQGREPLTQQKLQWIPWCHTWPCNWLTCIWVSGAQVNEKLYLKKLHHQMEDPYIQALHKLDCKWDLYLWSISTVVFLMTI